MVVEVHRIGEDDHRSFQLLFFRDALSRNRELGLVLLTIATTAASVIFPLVVKALYGGMLQARPERMNLTIATTVSLLLCILIILFEMLWGDEDNRRSLYLVAFPYLALVMLLLITFFPFNQFGDTWTNVRLTNGAVGLLAMVFAWVIALGWMADPNVLSLHQFYKARLVRAYLGASNEARFEKKREITQAAEGDDVLLTNLANCQNNAPYHLINTTLNLVGGRDLATAQRSSAAFLLSKLYCGSTRTGYRETDSYMNGRLSLGTAVAVSGAAVSPNMGSIKTSASLAMLMTLLNVRLG